ncbi:MAG: hypothetical protein H0U67_00300, partial [Gemmatimonadetes bacterium]|nr:hypothetical protein [Gemmatimonadota bacterium]
LMGDLAQRIQRLQDIVGSSTPEGAELRRHLDSSGPAFAGDAPKLSPTAYHLALRREMRKTEVALQTLRRRADRVTAHTRDDMAMDRVVRELAALWERHQGARPATPVSGRGRAGGPFIAFVDAFLKSVAAWQDDSSRRFAGRGPSAETIRARYRRVSAGQPAESPDELLD